MAGAGSLYEHVAFDMPIDQPDGQGGTVNGWAEQFDCRAEFIYNRGGEEVQAARLAGKASYKLRIRNSSLARSIEFGWRMRDARRGTEYQVREIDTISDRAWVYLQVESGVAV